MDKQPTSAGLNKTTLVLLSMGFIIGCSFYIFKKPKNRSNKSMKQWEDQLKILSKSIHLKSNKQISISGTSGDKIITYQQSIRIFELLFRISMQRVVWNNNVNKKRRRQYLPKNILNSDQVLEKYLQILVQCFIIAKRNAGTLLTQQLKRYKVDKKSIQAYSNTQRFINFKKDLKLNCMYGLQDIIKLTKEQYQQILMEQINFLNYKAEDILNKCSFATIGWDSRKKQILMQTFSLMIIDFTLLLSNNLRIKVKLEQIDQIDMEAAKKKYQNFADTLELSEKLEELLLRNAQQFKQTLSF